MGFKSGSLCTWEAVSLTIHVHRLRMHGEVSCKFLTARDVVLWKQGSYSKCLLAGAEVSRSLFRSSRPDIAPYLPLCSAYYPLKRDFDGDLEFSVGTG